MNIKELAVLLDGRRYGREMFRDEVNEAREAGLVVAFGASDDLAEFRGAINGEAGCYNGGTIYLMEDGLLQFPECGGEMECCPYYEAAKNTARSIRAVWHNGGGPCWTFETDLPHETFTINEDGKPYCQGIVFDVAARPSRPRIDRELDGVYFRVQRDGEWGNYCFSDLTAEERDPVLEYRSEGWLKELACHLADRLRAVGDQYDIAAGRE